MYFTLSNVKGKFMDFVIHKDEKAVLPSIEEKGDCKVSYSGHLKESSRPGL